MAGFFRVERTGNIIVQILLVLSFVLTHACTETNFAGGAAKATAQKKKKPRDSSSSGPQSLDMDFAGDKKIESVQNSKIWTASKNGIIKRFSIEGEKVTELKWDKDKDGNLNKAGNINASAFGIRTYLTESGALVGARFPYIYFVDPANSNTVQSIHIYPGGVPVGRDQNRICVASYLKDSKRYVIAVWGAGDFMEIPLSDSAPYAPLWNPLPAKQTASNWPAGAAWGYSCFIDQQQKIFYSQMAGAKVLGLNLKTMQLVDVDATVPNAKFTTTGELAKYSKSVNRSSYAVSGDSYGNLFNHLVDAVSDGYTSAHDKMSDTVWFSHRDGPYQGRIMVVDRKCLTIERNCTSANYHLYPLLTYRLPSGQNGIVSIGPISGLSGGRVAGLERSGSYGVYTMKLVDPKNIKGGIEVVKVGDAGGDPYMYTDFTGATLYINEAEQTFKPADMPKYAASKPIKMAVFKWVPTPAAASAGLVVEWKNIKLEARCYSGSTKPAFAEVGKVYDSSQGTALDVESCKTPNYEFVDVKLTQLNNDTTLLGVDTISVGFKQ
jgi:hypothetical protein